MNRRLVLVAAAVVLASMPRPVFAQAPPAFIAAQRQLQSGDAAGAAKTLKEFTATNPRAWRCFLLLGQALRQSGDRAGAESALRHAAEDPGVAPVADVALAGLAAEKGDIAGAKSLLDSAIAAGFADRGALFSDPGLAPLLARPEFARAMPPLLDPPELFVEGGEVLLQMRGREAGEQFGWEARRLDDVDGDHVLDFVTSAPTATRAGAPNAGRVLVVSSKRGKILFEHAGDPGDQLGMGVSRALDVNGDGTCDVFAGAPGSHGGIGRALVLSGKDGAVIHDLAGSAVGDAFGFKGIGVTDLDGDGKSEFAVAANGVDRGRGRVSIRSGATGKELFHLDGKAAGSAFGSALEVDEQSRPPRLLVGATGSGNGNLARVAVIALHRDHADELFALEGDAGSVTLGQFFVSALGDVDQDGVIDVFASDFGRATRGAGSGRCWVLSGKDGEPLITLDGNGGEGLGTSISDCGDVNGDGRADLCVGAWQNSEAAPSAGKIRLFSGDDGDVLATWTCKQQGDTLGFDACGIGDVDGDGAIDYLVTSAWSAVVGAQCGRLFILKGPKLGAK